MFLVPLPLDRERLGEGHLMTDSARPARCNFRKTLVMGGRLSARKSLARNQQLFRHAR
jgi:hypothetical protein